MFVINGCNKCLSEFNRKFTQTLKYLLNIFIINKFNLKTRTYSYKNEGIKLNYNFNI